jgi:hypothetical protein
MSTVPDVSHEVSLADKGMDRLVAGAPYSGHRISEGFKARVATYIERTQFRREAPWTRSARTARVSI